MDEYWTQPEKILDKLLVKSLTEVVRELRAKQLSALRCESKVLRDLLPEGHALKLVPKTTELSRIRIGRAIQLVVNGEPLTFRQIISKVQSQFPSVKSPRQSVLNTLARLSDSGTLVKTKVPGSRITYVRGNIDENAAGN